MDVGVILDKQKAHHKKNKDLKVSLTQGIFTPLNVVNIKLDKISEEDWKDIHKPFLDSECGNGNILVIILEHKLKYCKTICNALDSLCSIYGTESIGGNVVECRNKLYMVCKEFCINHKIDFKQYKQDVLKILTHNIVCTNSFDWDYDNWTKLEQPRKH